MKDDGILLDGLFGVDTLKSGFVPDLNCRPFNYVIDYQNSITTHSTSPSGNFD
jgi:hypothetical protein